MHVNHPQPWQLQQPVRQQLAVGGDHPKIWSHDLERRDEVRVLHPLGLQHRKPVVRRDDLHG